MSEKDWFRKKSWTDREREDFFTHLRRARPANRSQYLRIQAIELLEGKKPANLHAAQTLLGMLVSEYPSPVEMASTYHTLGNCCDLLGEYDAAASWYRKSLDEQRSFPNVIDKAHLSFALMVAERQRHAEYDEALAALDEWRISAPLPVAVFQACAARAIIHRNRGQNDLAIHWAKLALDAADCTHSGFRYHPELGLVGDAQKHQIEQMRQILQV